MAKNELYLLSLLPFPLLLLPLPSYFLTLCLSVHPLSVVFFVVFQNKSLDELCLCHKVMKKLLEEMFLQCLIYETWSRKANYYYYYY